MWPRKYHRYWESSTKARWDYNKFAIGLSSTYQVVLPSHAFLFYFRIADQVVDCPRSLCKPYLRWQKTEIFEILLKRMDRVETLCLFNSGHFAFWNFTYSRFRIPLRCSSFHMLAWSVLWNECCGKSLCFSSYYSASMSLSCSEFRIDQQSIGINTPTLSILFQGQNILDTFNFHLFKDKHGHLFPQ